MAPVSSKWIVPPETLFCNALALPCFQRGGPDSYYYVLVFAGSLAGWSLDSSAQFVKIKDGPSGSGYRSWALTVDSNRGQLRQATLHLRHGAETLEIGLVQAGSQWLQELAAMVLNPPPGTERAKFPLAMELGVAGKFIAQLLKKVPLPYRAAAYAAVVAAIFGLSATTIIARAAFTAVPEPPNYFASSSPPNCSLIEPPLMTVELIKQQTQLLIAYIGQQML